MSQTPADKKVNRRIMRFGDNDLDRANWLVASAKHHDAMIIVADDAIAVKLIQWQNSRVADPRRHWKAHMFSTAATMLAELDRAPRMLQKNVYDIYLFEPPKVFALIPEFAVQDWLTLMADPASTLVYVH